jgi:hypothetical protein
MTEEKRFPVLQEVVESKRVEGMPRSVKWSALDDRQAQLNHSQTLERLAERGGLSPVEMMCNVSRIGLWAINHDQVKPHEQVNFVKSIG